MTKIEDRLSREHFATLQQRPAVAGSEIVADPNSKHELDRRLDEALKETFPASDPISIVISSGK
jgi:hypothetical protein